jgi:hypothetical protein
MTHRDFVLSLRNMGILRSRTCVVRFPFRFRYRTGSPERAISKDSGQKYDRVEVSLSPPPIEMSGVSECELAA